MADSDHQPQATEASKKALKNVAAVSSPFRWKVRTPTPHPRKYQKDPLDKSEGNSTKKPEADGVDNKGFDEAEVDVEGAKAAEVEPELVDEEKKPRLDCYFILLAVVFGSSVLVVILYFTITSFTAREALIEIAENTTFSNDTTFSVETTTLQ